jgi:Glycosyltransferase family 87
LRAAGSRRVLRWVARLADERGAVNRRLTYAMALVAGVIALANVPRLQMNFPFGIDLEIPLRAVSHWTAGAPVYPPSAMQVSGGPDLPYLYPPFLLPFLTPFTSLPRNVVLDVWLVLCIAASVWTFRRLGIPWLAVPCMLAWPPYGEGLVVGNVQIFLFAAFVTVFYEPRDGAPRQRDLKPARDLPNGLLAGFVGVLKVGQTLALLYLARRRFRSALLGGLVLGGIVLATVPLTGIPIYFDWLAQLQRASDPGWASGGLTLSHNIGVPDAVTIAIGVAAALLLRGRDSVAWLGIALILATPNVHGHTFLFLLPGLLTLRRDLAIPIGALFLMFYTMPMWIAWGSTAFLLAASYRWPRLRVPQLQTAVSAAEASA